MSLLSVGFVPDMSSATTAVVAGKPIVRGGGTFIYICIPSVVSMDRWMDGETRMDGWMEWMDGCREPNVWIWMDGSDTDLIHHHDVRWRRWGVIDA